MQKYTKIEPLIVLVTCENINAVKTLYQYQNMDEFLRDEVMLYTTDVSNYVFGSMNSIMLCKNFCERKGLYVMEKYKEQKVDKHLFGLYN